MLNCVLGMFAQDLTEQCLLCTTGTRYARQVRAAVASHSYPQYCCMGEMPQHSPHPSDYAPEAAPQAEGYG